MNVLLRISKFLNIKSGRICSTCSTINNILLKDNKIYLIKYEILPKNLINFRTVHTTNFSNYLSKDFEYLVLASIYFQALKDP